MTEESLFVEALEIADPQAREVFLDTQCATKPDVRKRLARLLRTHERTKQFLETPAHVETLPLPSFQALQPDTLIDRYRILRLLGEGGMGSVYLAEQIDPVHRQVALKVIKTGLESPQVMMRFSLERQALAVMDHPNIAKVLDGGSTPTGQPYFVMELVQGVPITDYCQAHQLPPEARLELFITVCQAVQHAHQKGLIHRDLKPGNILVSEQEGKPVPKIIDFGVAKAMGHSLPDQSYHSFLGMLVGTLEYMSPEQARLDQHDVDTRTDVYSLGVILYELLTSTTPFLKSRFKQATFDEALRIIREDEPPKPSTRLSSLHANLAPLAASTSPAEAPGSISPLSSQKRNESRQLAKLIRGELDWIVMKALEKERNRRYETASSLAADVRRYLNDESVVACPPSTLYRIRKTIRRNMGAFVAASLILFTLVAGIIATTWGLIRATNAESIALSEVKQKEAALDSARKSERDSKEQLFQSLLNQAKARRFSKQMGQRLESLDAVVRAAGIRFDERLRDEAIAALALPDIKPGPAWNAFPPGTHSWSFDADYRFYARCEDDSTISIRTIADDKEIQQIRTTPSRHLTMWFTPDATHLARLNASHQCRVWRIADGKEVIGPVDHISTLAFSHDNRTVALGRNGSVLRFDLATGQELNRWKLRDNAVPQTMVFHPDNVRLAIGYAQASEVSIFDSTKGTLLSSLPIGDCENAIVAWHSDGIRLAVGQFKFIQIWDVTSKTKLATLEGHIQQVVMLTFHPQGNLLVSGSWDGVTRLWDVSTRRTLMQLTSMIYPRFSRDGRWMGAVLHGSEAQLLELIPKREYRTLVSEMTEEATEFHEGDISPDGDMLAVDMERAGVHLWHLKTGRQLAVLPSGLPLFHPDGKEILIANQRGMHRYSITRQNDDLSFSQTGSIHLPMPPTRMQRDQAGSKVAMVNESKGNAWLIDLQEEAILEPSLTHPRAGYVALSPDAKWIATSGWHSDKVRLSNTKTGETVHEWPTSRTTVFFTPDSRTLVLGQGDEFSFHDVDSRKLLFRLRRDVALYPGHVAFSPQTKLMAMEMAPGIVHLKEITTGKTVAKLEDPSGDRATWMSFTPDGSHLVVVALYAKTIHIWDLRAIRQRLKEMNLDWAWPEFPPAGK